MQRGWESAADRPTNTCKQTLGRKQGPRSGKHAAALRQSVAKTPPMRHASSTGQRRAGPAGSKQRLCAAGSGCAPTSRAPGGRTRRAQPGAGSDHGSPAPAAGSKRLRRSARWSHSTIKRRLCDGARSGVGVRTWALDCRDPQKGGPRSAALGPDAQRSPHLPVLARDRRGHQGRILFSTNLLGAEKFIQVPRSLGPEQSDFQGPWTHGAEGPSGWSIGQFGGS